MKREALLLAVALGTWASAQDYYARPSPTEPYTVLWQRQGSAPSVSSPSPALPGAPTPSTPSTLPTPPGEAFYSLPFLGPGALNPEGGAAVGGVASQSSSGETNPVLPPGRLFEAQLLTGVMATPLTDTPILAQAEGGWCGEETCPPLVLVGVASFSPNGRAVLTFNLGVAQGTVYSMRAFAFDPKDRLFGLTGKVMDIAPALAADLLRAAVGGLVDWVQALNRQSKTEVIPLPGVPGGGQSVVSSFEAAPFWAYALGRIGGVFSLPQDSTSIVRALVHGAGEKVLVATFPSEEGTLGR